MCWLCGNTTSEDAEDGDEALKKAVVEVQAKMATFMAAEKSTMEREGDKYVLKDHFIKLSMEKMERVKQKRENLKNRKKQLEAEAMEEEKSAASSKSRGTVFADDGASGAASSDATSKRRKKKKQREDEEANAGRPKKLTPKQLMEEEKAQKSLEWDLHDSVKRQKHLRVTGCLLPLAPLFHLEENEEGRMIKVEAPPVLYQNTKENQYAGLFRSVQEAAERRVDEELGGLEGEKQRFREPVSFGDIPGAVFDSITKSRVKPDDEGSKGKDGAGAGGRMPGIEEDSDDDLMEEEERLEKAAKKAGKEGDDGSDAGKSQRSKATNATDEDSQATSEEDGALFQMLMESLAHSSSSQQEEMQEGPKMLCCSAYLDGYCSKTTCPKAHPGIRDSAEVKQVRLPGRLKKVSYVTCCPLYNGNALTGCPEAGGCTKYHIYIRPSTRDIILRIYPKRKGENMKVMPSGAAVKGTLKANKLNGYGVMTWATGATYAGDWVNDQRAGWGIYRTPKGTEYSGGWLHGKRDGFGCYLNSIGEEYTGEWSDGRMHGVGRLQSANGDFYEGQFKHHKYHGVGTFTKANGLGTYSVMWNNQGTMLCSSGHDRSVSLWRPLAVHDKPARKLKTPSYAPSVRN